MAKPETVLLFSSFRGNGEDGLHLARSRDGYRWQALNHDKSFLPPEVGGKLMRDPCLLLGPDGIYRMVWTSGWNDRVIGYADSIDLVHWSPQVAIPVMQNEPRTDRLANNWAMSRTAGSANGLIGSSMSMKTETDRMSESLSGSAP